MATKKQCDRCEVLATEGKDTSGWKRIRIQALNSNHYTEKEVCEVCASAVERAVEVLPRVAPRESIWGEKLKELLDCLESCQWERATQIVKEAM